MRSSGRPDGKLIGQLSLGALGLLMATAGAWGDGTAADVGSHHVSAGAADVMLADDAVFSAAALGPRDQAVLIGELARMASAEFRVDLDLREIPRGSATRTYRMHRLPDSDVRVWYRQKSEFEPHVLCVTVIEKTDRDN